jgi:hypothetical protein
MDPYTRQTIQGYGPAAVALIEALDVDQGGPLRGDHFEQLVALCAAVDDHAADRTFTAQRHLEQLLRAHFTSGAWWDVLLAHCTGAGWGCCEEAATPRQRLKAEYLPAAPEGMAQ